MNDLRGPDLAYAALDYIRDHPEEWDQRKYFCGTTACFAGHSLILAGNIQVEGHIEWFDCVPGNFDERRTARELLGWSPTQADHVFYYNGSEFSELEERVKNVLNGDID